MQVNIAVSRRLGIPLSTQVRDQIVAAISKGDLRPGDKLPTIRQLADFLDLNRNTIAQVYRALEQDGYLVTRGSGGTRVADTQATRAAVQIQDLHQLVRGALHAAERKGFTAQEFSEVALYEATQWQALRHMAFLVVDDYRGELEYLAQQVRHMLPEAIVHSALIGDLAPTDSGLGSHPLPDVDIILVPYYCLDKARKALAASGIPVMVAGMGPSVGALRQIKASASGKHVAIVCTDPAGPRYMERALRLAGVSFRGVGRGSAYQSDLDSVIARSEVVIASEGSARIAREVAGDRPVLVFSAVVNEETLAAIHRHMEENSLPDRPRSTDM